MIKQVTRELLLEIIDKQLFVALLCIIIAFLICWFFVLKLGFLFLNMRISFKKIFPLILIGSLYSFWSRQLLPLPAMGIGLPIIMAFLLWITAREIHPLKCGWAGMLAMLFSGAGDIIILGPVCSANQHIAFFLLKTAWGYLISTACEFFFPALALIILPQILPKFKKPLLPPIGPQSDRLDLTVALVYFGMYSTSHIATLVLFLGVISGSHLISLLLVLLWAIAIFTVLLYFRIINIMQKKFDLQISGLEAAKKLLEEENAKLEANKAGLEAEKAKLEVEKAELIKKVRKLSSANNMETALKSQRLDKIINEFFDRVNDIKNPDVEPENNREIDRAESGPVLKPVNWVKYQLKPSDRLILKYIAEGKMNKEIADEIYLTEGTVKNNITKLFKRFGVKDRVELARFAIENDLIEKD
jgi:DNA-binding NarL/FixJ family response regulator